ncbi:protocatechuate 3,4-dioxygenase subunit alpha [Xanthomonas maliensis]|uniref:protocatechuate 3,4-dioxygenase subunit alpha n=1 Tax=Xanthomonas maliensis TaxID=1321368 RepID=UPI00039E8838|nr:protocatechuate 3,4-dioxygenase subunit alpha [Xanthomonas maliensis]KAB7769674.1 protocatechuate 3,4-dioxygenase subunit alpha [Xanthomonas maliensis]
MSLCATPSQTVGPYYRLGLEPLYRNTLVPATAGAAQVQVSGRILDGAGAPVTDAVLELWQADANGRYAQATDPGAAAQSAPFDGWGRVPSDAQGEFSFSTIKPGSVPGPDGKAQAAHLVVLVFMRGLLRAAPTRMYFGDDPLLEHDPILALVPAARRDTLLAKAQGPGRYRWDIHMQGDAETVFFRY